MHLLSLDIPSLINSLSYVGIFLLLVLNGIFSFPSSQIVYIVCGVLISKGALSFAPALIAGALGNAAGNMILFYAVYRFGPEVATTFFKIPMHAVTAFHKKVEHHGLWMLFVGKLTPSLKVIVPFVAGLAQIKYKEAFFIFTLASFIWASAFISLGYFFGSEFSYKWFLFIMGTLGILVAFLFYKKVIAPRN